MQHELARCGTRAREPALRGILLPHLGGPHPECSRRRWRLVLLLEGEGVGQPRDEDDPAERGRAQRLSKQAQSAQLDTLRLWLELPCLTICAMLPPHRHVRAHQNTSAKPSTDWTDSFSVRWASCREKRGSGRTLACAGEPLQASRSLWGFLPSRRARLGVLSCSPRLAQAHCHRTRAASQGIPPGR